MKRFLSVFLCFVVIQSAWIPIVSSKDEEGIDIQKECYILNKLGIVEISEYDNLDTIVSRAEFVDYVCKAIKAEKTLAKRYFSDLPKEHWAAGSVNAMVERGIINLSADNKFNPDNAITYEQACKILVLALGYHGYVSDGAGLTGYVLLASQIGFGINVSDTNALSMREAIRLIYGAMTSAMAYPVGLKGDGIITNISKDRTLLSVYHSVFIEKGQLMGLYGESFTDFNIEKGEVLIDDKLFKLDTGSSIEDYFGQRVEYIYVDSDDDELDRVLYVEPLYKDNKIVIKSDQIEGFSETDYLLRYYDSNKNKLLKERIDGSAVVIFNGRRFFGLLSEKMDEFVSGSKKGIVELIDSDNNSSFDVVRIKSFEVFVASSYSDRNESLYNLFESNHVLDLSVFKQVIITNEVGDETSIPSIYPAVFLVAVSDDNNVVKVIVCSKSAEVNISSIIANDYKVVIDGQEVQIDKRVYPYISKNINLNATILVVYDMFGDIVYAKPSGGEMQIGYLRKVIVDNKPLSKDFYLSLYLQDKNFHNFKLADHVIIDEIPYTTEKYKELFLAFPGEKDIKTNSKGIEVFIERQVIRFALNSNMEITKIDTYIVRESEDQDNSLVRLFDGSSELVYCSGPKRFGMNIVVDKDITKYFVVPFVDSNGSVLFNGNTYADDIQYYGTSYTFEDWVKYTIEAYRYNTESLAAGVIVLKGINTKLPVAEIMYDSTSMALNSDGEIVYKLRGFSSGASVSYELHEDCVHKKDTLKQGDIVRVETDESGKIAYNIEKVFDAESKTFEPNGSFTDRGRYWYDGAFQRNNASNWRNPACQLTKSYPYMIRGGYISSSYELADAHEGIIDEVFYAKNLSVIVYDPLKEKNKIYIGSLTDIATYSEAGLQCDLILVNSRKQNIRQIFVYKTK